MTPLRHLLVSVIVLALLQGCAMEGPGALSGVPTPTRSWSSPEGWPEGRVPAPGDDVLVARGEVVLLDVTPPPLGDLSIEGALVFDARDLHLEASAIVVTGGLYIGSDGEPFRHRASITLTGPRREGDGAAPGLGRKVLAVVGGVLQLVAADDAPSWTKLSEDARAGDREIVVDDAGGWSAGDIVALASTDFEAWSGEGLEARDEYVEQHVIREVQGRRLLLEEPLRVGRVGRVHVIAGHDVDLRAEVARLTRRIKVQGDAASDDPSSPDHAFGGHVILTQGARARIHGVEFTRMGQLGLVGRYPLHLHMLGSGGTEVHVSGSSIHRTYNRCLTIHASDGAIVRDTVAFDAVGHCFFLEDGSERGNLLEGNLALMIKRPPPEAALLPSEDHALGPAAFWITHPDNRLIGNVAANSQGTGFWYALPERPTGMSAHHPEYADVRPRQAPLGVFRDNVAHSNRANGLHVDDGAAGDGTEPTWHRPRSGDAPVIALFEGFVAFKHRHYGAWFRGDHTGLRGAVLVDNAIGASFAAEHAWAEGSLFVGESGNAGTPRGEEPLGEGGRPLPRPWYPGFALRGFEFYDGPIDVRDSTFTGFEPDRVRMASAFAVQEFTSFSLSPANSVERVSFVGPTLPMHLVPRPGPGAGEGAGEDGYRSAVIVDRDGSLTGTAGRAVVLDDPFLTTTACTHPPDWGAAICPGRYTSLRLHDVAGDGLGRVTITRSDGEALVLGGAPHQPFPIAFVASLMLGEAYGYEFAGSSDHLRVEISPVDDGDEVIVALPYGGAEPAIYRDRWIDERNRLTPYASIGELEATDQAGYHHDGTTLTVRLVPEAQRGSASVEVCRRPGC
jgi:cell surface hyaluronidase